MGGLFSALMIVSGYYGELTVTGNLAPHWVCWGISMCFFLYIVYELLVGLAAATDSESDPEVSAGDDGDQLVHLPHRIPLPHVRHHRHQRRRRHPDRVLRVGHHLQVRRRP